MALRTLSVTHARAQVQLKSALRLAEMTQRPEHCLLMRVNGAFPRIFQASARARARAAAAAVPQRAGDVRGRGWRRARARGQRKAAALSRQCSWCWRTWPARCAVLPTAAVGAHAQAAQDPQNVKSMPATAARLLVDTAFGEESGAAPAGPAQVRVRGTRAPAAARRAPSPPHVRRGA